jgi:uncharacterized protein YceK
MKLRNIIVVVALMLSGCETVYHRNTVYQYDVVDTIEETYQADDIRDGRNIL